MLLQRDDENDPEAGSGGKVVADAFVYAVRMLKEELQLLQEPGSYVGEVVKVMGKNKVLVKVRMCETSQLEAKQTPSRP